MDDPQTTESIKMWQQLMQDIHPVVEKQLVKLALVMFKDAKGCEIEIKLPEKVSIYLEPYGGFKYLYNKYIMRSYKNHLMYAKALAQTFQFWMPCNSEGKRPIIEVFWR